MTEETQLQHSDTEFYFYPFSINQKVTSLRDEKALACKIISNSSEASIDYLSGNHGIILGLNSLCLLDFDPKDNPKILDNFLKLLTEEQKEVLFSTCYETTGSGGWHFYFSVQGQEHKFPYLSGSQNLIIPQSLSDVFKGDPTLKGVDFKWGEQLSICAPTKFEYHEKAYEWVNAPAFVKQLPGWLFDLIRSAYEQTRERKKPQTDGTGRKPLESAIPKKTKISSKEKKRLMEALAIRARVGGFDERESWIALGNALKNSGFSISVWKKLSWEEVSDDELKSQWDSFDAYSHTAGTLYHLAQGYLSPKEDKIDWSDLGLSKLFNQLGKDRFIFVAGLGWYELREGVWVHDDDAPFRFIVGDMRDQLIKKAVKNDYPELEKLTKLNRVMSVIDFSQRLGLFTKNTTELDQGNILPLLNGQSYDIETDKITSTPEHTYITKTLQVGFDEEKKNDRWQKLLERVLPDPEVRRYFQKAVGASFIPFSNEQCFFYLVGKGANGKSTVLEVLRSIVGEGLSTTLPREALTGGNSERYMASLLGKRFVIGSELARGDYLNESLLKSLSGGDRLSARFLYRESFNFRFGGMIWLFGNDLVGIHDTSEGIWRRLRLIEFKVTIPKNEQDIDLVKKILADKEGVLNWIIEGIRMYRSEGLIEPQEMISAKEEYRNEENPLIDFLNELDRFGIKEDLGGKVEFSDFYEAYVRYTAAYSIRNTYSKKTLSREIGKLRGFQIKASTGNKKFVYGFSVA